MEMTPQEKPRDERDCEPVHDHKTRSQKRGSPQHGEHRHGRKPERDADQRTNTERVAGRRGYLHAGRRQESGAEDEESESAHAFLGALNRGMATSAYQGAQASGRAVAKGRLNGSSTR